MAKNSGRKNGKKPALIPQPHGGALSAGGTPGNRGGTGRPPSRIRQAFRDTVDELGLEVVRDVLRGRVPIAMVGVCQKCGHEHEDREFTPLDALAIAPDVSEMLRAVDVSAKYGLGVPKVGYDEGLIEELSGILVAEVHDFLEMDDAEELLGRIKQRWVPVLAKKQRDG